MLDGVLDLMRSLLATIICDVRKKKKINNNNNNDNCFDFTKLKSVFTSRDYSRENARINVRLHVIEEYSFDNATPFARTMYIVRVHHWKYRRVVVHAILYVYALSTRRVSRQNTTERKTLAASRRTDVWFFAAKRVSSSFSPTDRTSSFASVRLLYT